MTMEHAGTLAAGVMFAAAVVLIGAVVGMLYCWHVVAVAIGDRLVGVRQ